MTRMNKITLWVVLCLPLIFIGGGCDETVTLPKVPVLVGLEEDVEQHLTATYARLESAIQRESGTELAASFGDAAITYHAYDLVLMAQSCYQQALVLDPDSNQWKYLLARILQKEGKTERALQLFSEILSRLPDHPPTLLAAAELKLQSGDSAGARIWFQQLLRIDPRSAPAFFGLGRISLQDGQHSDAIRFFEEALRYSPAATGLRYPYGLALRDAGRESEAQQQMLLRGPSFPMVPDRWLEEVRNRPIGARIPLNRGTTRFKAGQYHKALEQFQRAVQVAPDSATAQLNLGSALVKLGRSPEALGHYQEALRLDPGSTTAWFDLGVIHARAGDEEEAIRCYDQTLAIESGHQAARFNRANSLRRLKQYQEAAKEMKTVRQQVPGNVVAWIAEVVCYLRLEQPELALSTCQEGKIATGNAARLVSLLARLEATSTVVIAKPQLMKTLGELENLLLKETTLELVECKAMVLAALNRFKEALQWQNSAIDAARSANRIDILERLQKNQQRYFRGEPAVDPWPEESASTGSGSGVGSVNNSTSQ